MDTNKLQQIYNTLGMISVHGTDDMSRMLACMNEINLIIQKIANGQIKVSEMIEQSEEIQ